MALTAITQRTTASLAKAPKISSNQLEVKDSASIDLEWLPFKGRYAHNKTKIYAACFCTNKGERIAMHISEYPTERDLVSDILFYFNQFPLTFGWYSTGVAVYDDDNNSDSNSRLRGRDSDFFILHQRCQLYGLKSPFELRKTYVKLLDLDKKYQRYHIDLYSVFNKKIIQDSVFQGRYRTVDLDTVGLALIKLGKYGKLKAGTTNMQSLPVDEQIRYVKRDAELTMLLAQYNNCLALKIMKVFSKYSKMDYYQVCHTNVSHWYANLYNRMLESGECSIANTPNYKLPKEEIGGGHHTDPVKGFYDDRKVYELDVKGQYPSIVINNNFSFDTINCTCCRGNEAAQLKQELIDTINEHLESNEIDRRVKKYWVCRNHKGAFPKVIEKLLLDRDRYLTLLKEEKKKANPDFNLIEEYETHQLGAKLFANAGAGLFGNQYFEFSNYVVNECITAEGRRIHKQMELMGKQDPYNFSVVFGFTDSTFFTNVPSDEMIKQFIADCKDKLGDTVELKNTFMHAIFYSKKNRFVAWSGKENEEPIIKGLNGLSEFDPLWVKEWFKRILHHLVKDPTNRFEVIPSMLKEAFADLDNGRVNPEELKFTQRLGQYLSDYKTDSGRAYKLGKLLDKDKGDLIYWYATTYTEEYIRKGDKKHKKCYRTKKSYDIEPIDLDYNYYKNWLFKKLKDTLEIAGFNVADLNAILMSYN